MFDVAVQMGERVSLVDLYESEGGKVQGLPASS